MQEPTQEEILKRLQEKRDEVIQRLAELENAEGQGYVEETLLQLAYEDSEAELAKIDKAIENLAQKGVNNA